MNFEDISFFFFLGFLLDICILIGSIRFFLGKTTDNQIHAFGFPLLAYFTGFLSGAFFKRKILISVYILMLCVILHFLIVILVNCLVKKKDSTKK